MLYRSEKFFQGWLDKVNEKLLALKIFTQKINQVTVWWASSTERDSSWIFFSLKIDSPLIVSNGMKVSLFKAAWISQVSCFWITDSQVGKCHETDQSSEYRMHIQDHLFLLLEAALFQQSKTLGVSYNPLSQDIA